MWPYDAAHVAWAETLRAQLVTVDRKIARTPGIRVRRPQPHQLTAEAGPRTARVVVSV
jgi:hypothetical protein